MSCQKENSRKTYKKRRTKKPRKTHRKRRRQKTMNKNIMAGGNDPPRVDVVIGMVQ